MVIMAEPFEVNYFRNKIAWIILLLFSPVMFYLDYNIYIYMSTRYSIEIINIPFQMALSSIVGFVLSTPLIAISYNLVKKDWMVFVEEVKSTRKEHSHVKRFHGSRVLLIPIFVIIYYLTTSMNLSPLSMIYFLGVGVFFFWSLVIKKLSKQSE